MGLIGFLMNCWYIELLAMLHGIRSGYAEAELFEADERDV